LYSADIDTTFYLHNKHGNGSRIRIAGNFTARHLPFYINDGVLTNTDKYNMYNSSKFSTMKPLFLNYYNQIKNERYSNTEFYCDVEVNVPLNSKIRYGVSSHSIDVTDVAHNRCVSGDRIIIPSGDQARADIFGDPLPFIIKSIFVDYIKNDIHPSSYLTKHI
jgi:hypothetical protein